MDVGLWSPELAREETVVISELALKKGM